MEVEGARSSLGTDHPFLSSKRLLCTVHFGLVVPIFNSLLLRLMPSIVPLVYGGVDYHFSIHAQIVVGVNRQDTAPNAGMFSVAVMLQDVGFVEIQSAAFV